jgi:hypothetical protein
VTGEVDPIRRSRGMVLLHSVARSTATVSAVLAVYFLSPASGEASAWLLAAVAVLATLGVFALFVRQLRSIRRSPYPMLRAVEGMVSIAVLFLAATAAVHAAFSVRDPQAYTELLSRLDSLYFTVTMLSTVGFGDITPVTPLARAFTTVQMVLGVALVTGAVKALVSVARAETERRAAGSR